MSRKLDEKIVIERILDVCKEISTEKEIISFLGFKDGKYESCKKTKLILHNSKTEETWDTTSYPDFLNYKSKGSFGYTSKHQAPSKEEIIKKIFKKHPEERDYWDLSEIGEYSNNKTPIKVICNHVDPITGDKHGEFYPTVLNLLRGDGCPKCSGNYHYTTEEFIKKANIIHGGKYTYEKTEYKLGHDKIIVTCPRHGDFLTTPAGHLYGPYGCPRCSKSRGEKKSGGGVD